MMLRKLPGLTLFLALSPCCKDLTAQTITQPIYADSLLAVAQHLAGPGVVVNAAYYLQIPEDFGTFTDSIGSFGMHAGLMLCTGMRFAVEGPNYSPSLTAGGGFENMGDQDLQQLVQPQSLLLSDAAVFTIELVPLGDSLRINYVFSSEEYNEWVCSAKNDLVGIFLSGPGISGTFYNGAINMATLPGTDLPVCVNSVNAGIPGFESLGLCDIFYPGWQQDSAFYVDNTNGIYMQMDGYTTVLTARAAVTPGATYTMRIAIADVDDANYDSAVFLENGSLWSDLSTAVGDDAGIGHPLFWYDHLAGSVNVSGLKMQGPEVELVVFDAAGRCVSRGRALDRGTIRSTPLMAAPGAYIVRALQDGRAHLGRIVVPGP